MFGFERQQNRRRRCQSSCRSADAKSRHGKAGFERRLGPPKLGVAVSQTAPRDPALVRPGRIICHAFLPFLLIFLIVCTELQELPIFHHTYKFIPPCALCTIPCICSITCPSLLLWYNNCMGYMFEVSSKLVDWSLLFHDRLESSRARAGEIQESGDGMEPFLAYFSC